MSPSNETEEYIDTLVERKTDRELLEQIAADSAESVRILADLAGKINAGVATLPEVLDKLGNVPIIGGAIRTLFQEK